jgi:tRNA A-37 threonylcarbamoyl transferase component Bud32
MKLVINPECACLTDFVREVPYCFTKQGESLYKSRNELKIFDTDYGKVVVKSFRIPHFINRIAYSFLRHSKAERSYIYSLKIRAKGFDIPVPIAYIEVFKAGLLSESYYVSTYSDRLSMRKFSFIQILTEDDIEILKAFARFTARLHEKGIYHLDYSNGNILCKRENEGLLFNLVDVNRMQFKRVTEKMAYKAFHRLDFSMEMLEIVAKEYALQRQFDVEKSIAEIKKYNRQTMRRYQTLHSRPKK